MFSTGDEVFLINTGDFGIVLAQYDEKTLLIEIDGDEIPIYFEDLIPAAQARAELAAKEEARLKAQREQEARFKQERIELKQHIKDEAERNAKQEEKAKQRRIEEAQRAAAEARIPKRAREELIQSGIQRDATEASTENTTDKGIHLLFVKNDNGPMGLWLSNNSPETLLIDFVPHYGGIRAAAVKGEVAAGEMFALGNFDMDLVNEKPQFHLQCWLKSPSKVYASHFKAVIKLKASAFMRRLASEGDAAQYTFMEKLPAATGGLKEFGANLAADDKRKGRKGGKMQQNWTVYSTTQGRARGSSDPMRRAGFPDEIDLHIEKLLPRQKNAMLGGQARKPKMQRGEELRIQLQHCQRYLAEAISLGVEKVYLIHGLGKGKLRDEIAAILRAMPEVVRFNNDYHPRYGFGATEVILVEK